MTHITRLYDAAINMCISYMYQITLLPSSDYNRCLLTTAVIIILSDTGCCGGLQFNAWLWSAAPHSTVTHIHSILLCFGRNKLQGTASCAIHASRADQARALNRGKMVAQYHAIEKAFPYGPVLILALCLTVNAYTLVNLFPYVGLMVKDLLGLSTINESGEQKKEPRAGLYYLLYANDDFHSQELCDMSVLLYKRVVAGKVSPFGGLTLWLTFLADMSRFHSGELSRDMLFYACGAPRGRPFNRS